METLLLCGDQRAQEKGPEILKERARGHAEIQPLGNVRVVSITTPGEQIELHTEPDWRLVYAFYDEVLDGDMQAACDYLFPYVEEGSPTNPKAFMLWIADMANALMTVCPGRRIIEVRTISSHPRVAPPTLTDLFPGIAKFFTD
ncbi:MAG: hypothetical protein BWY68_00512 [bacterium ADurb.Bin400]|nr:MAG: hypothetical protein BWY68_00512 [bacterium ADurb.Bin400]